MEAYQIVTETGAYNSQKARLLLKSQLNANAWEENLQDYWDWQLVQYIKFGFPLDLQPQPTLTCDYSNHKSATLFPEHVDTYLQEEKVLGPYVDLLGKNNSQISIVVLSLLERSQTLKIVVS